MSLLTILALAGPTRNLEPRELAPANPHIIVEAKCPGCGVTLRYKTDPRKDTILLGYAEGECTKCKAPMTNVPLKLWVPS